jgi:hypothetical protein
MSGFSFSKKGRKKPFLWTARIPFTFQEMIVFIEFTFYLSYHLCTEYAQSTLDSSGLKS